MQDFLSVSIGSITFVRRTNLFARPSFCERNFIFAVYLFAHDNLFVLACELLWLLRFLDSSRESVCVCVKERRTKKKQKMHSPIVPLAIIYCIFLSLLEIRLRRTVKRQNGPFLAFFVVVAVWVCVHRYAHTSIVNIF